MSASATESVAVRRHTSSNIDDEYRAEVVLSNGSSAGVDFNVLEWDSLSDGIADVLVNASVAEHR
ncbi:MAG: hypothetical protein AAF756_14390 [Pseudomonadota bacterium]